MKQKLTNFFKIRNFTLVMLLTSFFACHCQSEGLDAKGFNSFVFHTDSKQELKDRGFKSVKLMQGVEDPDLWFKIIIGDTILQFHFDEDVLSRKEVIFDLKKVDTSWLFEHLYSMGFKRGKGTDSLSKFAMAQPRNKNVYDVYINRKEIAFVRWVNRRRESIPSPAKTIDN